MKKGNPSITKDIRVCIADDHHFVREAMLTLVETFPRVNEVYAVEDGVKLMDSLPKKKPNIVMLDVRMPNMDGIGASEQILEQYPDIKILVLTMNEDSDVMINLLQMGVHGYLTKNADVDSVENALYQIMDDGEYFDDIVTKTLVGNLKNEHFLRPKTTKAQAKMTFLTEREVEILKLMCEELDNDAISKQLGISVKTLSVHKQNIYKKTDSKSLISLFRFALRTGIIEP